MGHCLRAYRYYDPQFLSDEIEYFKKKFSDFWDIREKILKNAIVLAKEKFYSSDTATSFKIENIIVYPNNVNHKFLKITPENINLISSALFNIKKKYLKVKEKTKGGVYKIGVMSVL